ERPQKGRYRQFHQIGAEVLGTGHPAVEAEVIDMLERFLRESGLNHYRLKVNSVGCANCRPGYIARLREQLDEHAAEFCEQCRWRTRANPMRVLDCKVPSCQPLIAGLPRISDSLCTQCRDHFAQFLDYLDLQNVVYEKDDLLVRGLDYYVRTTFEMVTDKLGPTQNALLGGGRYDGLSQLLGGPPTQGFGFALGLERLALVLTETHTLESEYRAPAPEIFLAYMDAESWRESFKLARELRHNDVFAFLDFGGRSLKAQLRLANRIDAKFTCVVGENEIRSGRFPVKRMRDGQQEILQRQQITRYVKNNR
ncbi:MAG: histidine--tRNA ligase, partial [Acidobacteriota bacterium]